MILPWSSLFRLQSLPSFSRAALKHTAWKKQASIFDRSTCEVQIDRMQRIGQKIKKGLLFLGYYSWDWRRNRGRVPAQRSSYQQPIIYECKKTSDSDLARIHMTSPCLKMSSCVLQSCPLPSSAEANTQSCAAIPQAIEKTLQREALWRSSGWRVGLWQ